MNATRQGPNSFTFDLENPVQALDFEILNFRTTNDFYNINSNYTQF